MVEVLEELEEDVVVVEDVLEAEVEDDELLVEVTVLVLVESDWLFASAELAFVVMMDADLLSAVTSVLSRKRDFPSCTVMITCKALISVPADMLPSASLPAIEATSVLDLKQVAPCPSYAPCPLR